MDNDVDRLRESWRDLAFGVMKAVGIVALVRRLGLTLKPWAAEREVRGRSIAPEHDGGALEGVGPTWTCIAATAARVATPPTRRLWRRRGAACRRAAEDAQRFAHPTLNPKELIDVFRVAGAAFMVAIFVGIVAHSETVGTVTFFVMFALIAIANVGQLRCPACRMRVKLGASRCHWCGQDVEPLIAQLRRRQG